MVKEIDRCPLCGGNAGRIPEGGHYLCQELAKRGLPTPNLGEKCAACGGSGTSRRTMPANVALPLNPTAAEIRLWFPTCPTCDGKGYTKPGENPQEAA